MMDAETKWRRRDVFADERERERDVDRMKRRLIALAFFSLFTYSSFITHATRRPRAEPYSIHLVTSWMAFASLATVEDVTPAMEMRPFLVM